MTAPSPELANLRTFLRLHAIRTKDPRPPHHTEEYWRTFRDSDLLSMKNSFSPSTLLLYAHFCQTGALPSA